MIRPARRDITINQRATFRQRMRLKADGVAINATGYQLVAQVWDRRRTVKYADLTVSWIEQSAGLFELVLQYPGTTTVVNDGVWDLLVIEPNGDRYYWLEGVAYLDPGHSAPVTP
jgi:hypothetical protein